MTKESPYYEEEEELTISISEKAPNVKNLSPTKIADQFWCEMQLHLRLHLGLEPTEVMITGSEIHRSLEEELGPVIEVVTTTLEDSIITYILQVYSKLKALEMKDITRELPVIGELNDLPVLGIIDQLKVEVFDGKKQLLITDYKTRKSMKPPSYEQKRRNRIQLQVYWHLLNDLIRGKFTSEKFIKYFEMPETIVPSEALLTQLPDDMKELLSKNSPHQLLEESFQIYTTLPSLSTNLEAIYLHQEDQTVVYSDRTLFHEESFEVDMEWALGYWLKVRNPSESQQQWMCNYCPFTEKCSYFLRRYLEKQENKKKK
ncbi:MAG: PD-(D/E)XK nuclease family protein [Candidatus Heimdallarchaeota archaeon]|nr:PD-(D/E)XK nuclease family protein [Candidatus Heimdallarchaeota archaeon]